MNKKTKTAKQSRAAFGYLVLNKQSLKIIRANMKRITKTKNTITAVQYPEASSQLAKAARLRPKTHVSSKKRQKYDSEVPLDRLQ